MLRRLLLTNLTVFARAEVEPAPGLTVITGETGAGKTVLTQAINMISGADVDRSLIGPDAEEGYAEAEFSGPPPSAIADLAVEDGSFVLARRLRPTASRALVDGRSCSASLLREAAEPLVALTGQHAARQLINPDFQRDLLTRFAGLTPLVERVQAAWRLRERSRGALEGAREELAEARRREDLLRHEVAMVQDLDPQEGEEESLQSERARLAHAETLREQVQRAAVALNGEDVSSLSLLQMAARDVEEASGDDPELAPASATLTDMVETMLQISRELQHAVDGYSGDPARLEEIEERLAALGDLRRRYGGVSLAEIVGKVAQDAETLAALDHADQHLRDLARQQQEAEEAYVSAAAQLRAGRLKAARRLSTAVDRELAELGLQGARLTLELVDCAPGPQGTEGVQMLLAANAGLAPAPLDRGASGGELSRVNLALLLAVKADAGATLIFDEVDAGIGGEVAHVLGRKLAQLAESSQVIVITHLAQIAVHADLHLRVAKRTSKGRTLAQVTELDPEAQEIELGRLIGAKAGDAADAAQMLRRAAGL